MTKIAIKSNHNATQISKVNRDLGTTLLAQILVIRWTRVMTKILQEIIQSTTREFNLNK